LEEKLLIDPFTGKGLISNCCGSGSRDGSMIREGDCKFGTILVKAIPQIMISAGITTSLKIALLLRR
jgi:hypothetical protein